MGVEGGGGPHGGGMLAVCRRGRGGVGRGEGKCCGANPTIYFRKMSQRAAPRAAATVGYDLAPAEGVSGRGSKNLYREEEAT
jgi:hypothetical protein